MFRAAGCFAIALAACLATPVFSTDTFVEGVVLDPDGRPIGGATIRIQATLNEQTTGTDGRFRLEIADSPSPFRVTVWKDGYYVSGTDARPGQSDRRLTLGPHVDSDHPG